MVPLLLIIFLLLLQGACPLRTPGSPLKRNSGIHVGRCIDLVASSNQSSSPPSAPKFQQLAANGLGYLVGAGAMTMYSPIIYTLLKSGETAGLSSQTFAFNLVGVSLAMLYTIKKGFPVSTYVELIAISAQYVVILTLISSFNGVMPQLGMGLLAYSCVFGGVLWSRNIPPRLLDAIQVLSVVLCNYANIPQIVQSFQTRRSSWSLITCLLSMTGCSVRIFTTLTLAKERLPLLGYAFALLTNSILLAQILAYSSPKPHVV